MKDILLDRRRFLSVAPLLGAFRAAAPDGKTTELTDHLLAHRRTPGEPYEVAGNRIVFTNWRYVSPGDARWVDAHGASDYMHGSASALEAHYSSKTTPYGIRLMLQPANRLGPILRPERLWETRGVSFHTVIRESNRYRAWGRCGTKDGRAFSCYFESTDGLHWERPELGLAEFEGSRKNNLLDQGSIEPHWKEEVGTVFIDPSAPGSERYKAVRNGIIERREFESFLKARPDGWEPRALLALEKSGNVHVIAGAVSADGLRWKQCDPLVAEYSDTQVVAYYDTQLRSYVIYTRFWATGLRTERLPADIGKSWTGIGRRAIGRSVSTDFRSFPPSRLIMEPGPEMLPSDVLYTNSRTTVPGAPDLHLLFPSIWHVGQDNTSVVMASSGDGEVWNYVPGGQVLTTSDFGQWDGGCVFASPNLVELPDGAFALPYTGYSLPHKYPRGELRFQQGYAVWPKGRLVALEAPEHGEFLTASLIAPGRKLLINAVTQRVGAIAVEVTGARLQGRSFEQCTPIVGDQYRTPVSWGDQDSLGVEPGATIRLRFRMDKAKIFGLEFV